MLNNGNHFSVQARGLPPFLGLTTPLHKKRAAGGNPAALSTLIVGGPPGPGAAFGGEAPPGPGAAFGDTPPAGLPLPGNGSWGAAAPPRLTARRWAACRRRSAETNRYPVPC